MSAQFREARNKHNQAELRKFMKEHKNKAKGIPEQKIDSPLAKYNETGQLTCILCKTVVRSAKVWIVHTNGKQHRDNVDLAKKLKEKTNNFTKPLKRPLSPVRQNDDSLSKKPKGILKNATLSTSTQKASSSKNDVAVNSNVPADFFDNKNVKIEPENSYKSKAQSKQKSQNEEVMEVESEPPDEALPEGFFDDPKLDAKARNIEYKDPVEEEWERYQKEIKNADHESEAIIADDQEEATTERQIDEIDEQMKNWSRVLTLEKKKVEVVSSLEEPMLEEDSSLSGDEFGEYFDWRSKKS